MVANIDPARMHRMCQLWFEGKTAESARLQLESMGLCKAMFCDVNPIPVKAAMNMMGWNAGPAGCRWPLGPGARGICNGPAAQRGLALSARGPAQRLVCRARFFYDV